MQKSFVLTLLAAIILVGAACSPQEPLSSNTNTVVTAPIPRGLSFSPTAITAEGLTDFFSRASQAGSYVSWAGPASDLAKSSGGPNLVLTRARQASLIPIMIVSPTAADLKTETAWTAWHDTVVAFAKSSQVEYFGVGNEVNKSLTAADRATFSEKYEALVNDIHTVSPQTKVFVTLQYEWLVGLRGGLFGGTNDSAQSQWGELSLNPFFTGDLIAFTTYPGLIYKSPTDIPDSYYDDILHETSLPVAFTELGWFRTGPTGWNSNVVDQAAAIQRFRQLTVPIDPVFSLWSFLYDPAAPEPFSTMGLLGPGETDTLAWQAWIK